MATASPSPAALVAFSTCEISDALIKLGIPHGGYVPDIGIFSPANPLSEIKLCGPAYTVEMVLSSDTPAPKLSTHFVDTVPDGHVVVINAPPEAKNAVWGGLMTAGAQARGAIGVVISGRCRDISEHRSLGFPVFARGHSTLGQSPFTRPTAVNVPITIKPQGLGSESFPAVTIYPSDWVIADEDGVVCVPKDLTAQTIALARKGREVDEKCMHDIKAGLGIQNSFTLHRGK